MSSSQTYQASLFDAPVKREPAVVLDIREGKRLMEEGIEKAVLHADQEIPDWKEKAFGLLLQFTRKQQSSFMAEDLRSYAALIDFPLPPNARAWGGIIAKAAREGLIERIGIQKVKNKKAHCANAAVWRRI